MKWTNSELADLKKTVKRAKNNKEGIALFAEKSGRPVNNVTGKYYYLMAKKRNKKRKYNRKAVPASQPIVQVNDNQAKYLSFDMTDIKCVSFDKGVLTIFL